MSKSQLNWQTLAVISGLLCFSCTAVALPSAILNQQRFEYITTADGLPSNSVRRMLQDSQGYLWFATQSGLCRFDGYRCTTFKHQLNQPESLPDNTIYALYEDSEGALWIGSQSGLSRFDRQTQSFLHYPLEPISDIVEDNKGYLWLVSPGGALRQFNLSNQKMVVHDYRASLQLPLSYKSCYLVLDHQQRLWISGLSQLVSYNLKNTQVRRYALPVERPTNVLSKAYLDEHKQLWFGSGQGTLLRLDLNKQPHKIHQQPLIAQPSQTTITGIFKDREGLIWVTTNINSLYKIKGEAITHYAFNGAQLNSAQATGQLTDILQTRDGTLLVASQFSGVIKLSTSAKQVRTIEHTGIGQSTFDLILSVVEDQQARIWLTTSQRLYRLNSTTGQSRVYYYDKNRQDGLPDSPLSQLYIDAQGIVWLSTQKQLLRYQPETDRFVPFAVWDERFWVVSFVEDRHGRFLLGTANHGVLELDRQTGQVNQLYSQQQNQLSSNAIYALMEDNRGHLWLGTPYGLNQILPDGQVRVYQSQSDNADSLSNNLVVDIIEDNSGYLWISTWHGLNRLDPKSGNMMHFTEEQGLPENILCRILKDQNGSLWIGSANGIFRFDPQTFAIEQFNQLDGLSDSGCTIRAAYRSSNGSMYFAYRHQLSHFDPQLLRKQRVQPITRITKIKVNGRQLTLSADIPKQVKVNYPYNNLDIAFSTFDYVNPNSHRYRYRLSGIDDDWTETDAQRRFVNYSHLSSGEYVFSVKGANRDGVWSQPATLALTLSPPWWRTTLALVGWGLLMSALLYLLLNWRLERLLKRNYALEQKVRQRTAKINRLLQQKQQLFANISHEFRTPLTLVLSALSRGQQTSSSSLYKGQLVMAERNARRLLQMVGQLLDIARYNATQPPAFTVVDINALTAVLCEPFVTLAQDKQQTIDFIPAPQRVLLWADPHGLEKILSNLLSNGIKYTQVQSCITVEITTQPPMALITVTDNGPGVPKDQQSQVFEYFYRLPQHQSKAQGVGIGLALVKELVNAHQGRVTLDSDVGRGCVFKLYFPLASRQQCRDHTPVSLVEVNSANLESTIHQDTAFAEQPLMANTPAGSKTLLLVDDNDDMRDYLRQLLQEQGQYHCMMARDGQQALALAIEQIPDLIISDVMMPGIDGFELTDRLKNTELTSHIPVMLLTARGDQQSRLKGLQQHADEYLSKPFDEAELMLKITNLLTHRDKVRQHWRHNNGMQRADEPILADATPAPLGVKEQLFMNKVAEVVEKHYQDSQLSVETLAAQMHITSRQFRRKLKALSDISPNAWLQNYRLEKSLPLLITLPELAEVAYQVGFDSYNYYGRCFRQKYDMTPKQYRDQMLR